MAFRLNRLVNSSMRGRCDLECDISSTSAVALGDGVIRATVVIHSSMSRAVPIGASGLSGQIPDVFPRPDDFVFRPRFYSGD
jgi:hypothetical protein